MACAQLALTLDETPSPLRYQIMTTIILLTLEMNLLYSPKMLRSIWHNAHNHSSNTASIVMSGVHPGTFLADHNKLI